jgi:hypothetical protein
MRDGLKKAVEYFRDELMDEQKKTGDNLVG